MSFSFRHQERRRLRDKQKRKETRMGHGPRVHFHGIAPWGKKARYGQRSYGVPTKGLGIGDWLKNSWATIAHFLSAMAFRDYRNKIKQKGI